MFKFIVIFIIAALIAAFYFLYIPASDIDISKEKMNELSSSMSGLSKNNDMYTEPDSAISSEEDTPSLEGEALEENELDEESVNSSVDERSENYQEDLPPEFMEKALEEIERNAPNMTPPPDMGPEAMMKMEKNNLQDTVSLDELPTPIADEMRADLDFREKKGYDKESDEEASTVKSILSNLSGTSVDILNLTFELSDLPISFTESYQYVGYAYQTGTEEEKSHSTIKRVYSKHSDNSIVIIEETSLANGSATLTTEFVNQQIYGCPAILVEKRNATYGNYAQLNWNTRNTGFVIFQLNATPLKRNLVDLAESISRLNDSNSCEQSQTDTDSP